MTIDTAAIADLNLEGALNFRAVRGIPGMDGRTIRDGALFRCGTLEALSDTSIREVAELGIRTVFDLRSARERELYPSRLVGADGLDVIDFQHEGTLGDLAVVLQSPDCKPEDARRSMLGIYREFPQAFAPIFGDILARLATQQRPALVHCMAGKDRTGAMVALILSALGAPRDAIVEDYLGTNRHTAALIESLADRRERRDVPPLAPEVVLPVLTADADYLAAMFKTIEDGWGGVDAYLERGLGLDPASRDRLRGHMLG